jgi:hypothetical protein
MSPNGPRSTVVQVHHRRGRSLNSLAIQLSAFALTFILIALLVVTSSRAAFVAQNENTTNQVTSAAISLSDTDSGTAMFNVPTLMPGTTEERCIDVTYTGTVDPTAIKLYRSGAPTGTLAPYLDLTIQVGADSTPAFGNCTGFVSAGTLYTGTLANFASSHTGYVNGLTAWDPTGTPSPDTRTFRFALSVQDNNAAINLTSTFGFSWETRTS